MILVGELRDRKPPEVCGSATAVISRFSERLCPKRERERLRKTGMVSSGLQTITTLLISLFL